MSRAPRRWLSAVLVSAFLAACTAQNPAFVAPQPADSDVEPAVPTTAPDAQVTRPDLAAQALPADAAPAYMPDVTAPADAAAAVLPDAPPDLAADRGPPGAVLLVVGDTALEKSDVQLKDRLIKLGFTVTARDGTAVTSADATGKALVVISGSSWSDDVGSKFRDVTVPVVCFDRALFSPMKLTGSKSGTDYGELDYAQRLMIIDDTHPLAGGLSGQVTVSNADMMVSWGLPSSAAVRVATTTDSANRFTIFGYEQGATMVGMTAPARRVGSFVRYPRDTTFTESGLLLFEGSALWAIGYR
jgi:hypothetical protein